MKYIDIFICWMGPAPLRRFGVAGNVAPIFSIDVLPEALALPGPHFGRARRIALSKTGASRHRFSRVLKREDLINGRTTVSFAPLCAQAISNQNADVSDTPAGAALHDGA